jgi:hypothetical protein
MNYAIEDTRHTDHANDELVAFERAMSNMFESLQGQAKKELRANSVFKCLDYAFECLNTNDLAPYLEFCDVKNWLGSTQKFAEWGALCMLYEPDSYESMFYLSELLGLDSVYLFEQILEGQS